MEKLKGLCKEHYFSNNPESGLEFKKLANSIEQQIKDIIALRPDHAQEHVKSKDVALQIIESTKITRDSVVSDEMIKRALINRKDEFGNTALHLAAWNGKMDMFDCLIQLGADPNSRNKDGLTAFTLSIRFGLWESFNHIWKKHYTTAYWSFGNVAANIVEYRQFDSIRNGLTSFSSDQEIDLCIEALLLFKVCSRGINGESDKKSSDHKLRAMKHEVNQHIKVQCEDMLIRSMIKNLFKPSKVEDDNADPSTERSKAFRHLTHGLHREANYTKSGVELITHFRPKDWYAHTKEIMEEVVLNKWSRVYYLVHIGDSLIPYSVVLLLFCLMWWQRKLNILVHNFWWSPLSISAPAPSMDVESSCGWTAISSSNSGALQAALILYGVPSLLRLGLIQCRVSPNDLDENVDWKVTSDELVTFLYLNLESLLDVIIAGLFITIGASRVAAGDQCDVGYLRTEKNAIAIAALALFFNLFILCKPYKGLGLLVLTWYRFLLSDLFSFLIMYCIVFTAFLIALQTLHDANYAYLMWMETTDNIFPQVQQAIGLQFPGASQYTNLTYMANTNPTNPPNILLTADVDLNGCLALRHRLVDTAFALLEISFGDGLADGLEQARSKPYECAGFTPDYLIGYLLVLWVFLTNTLLVNMLIAMMNNTFDAQREELSSVWLLDISKRMLRYDVHFLDLGPRIAMMEQGEVHTMTNARKYILSWLDNIWVIVRCVPEVHLAVMIVQVIQVYRDNTSLFGDNDKQGFWGKIRTAIEGYEDWLHFERCLSFHFKFKENEEFSSYAKLKAASNNCCGANIDFLQLILHPQLSFNRIFNGTSIKLTRFGKAAEKEARKQSAANDERMQADSYSESEEDQRVVTLIYRLLRLRETMQRKKLKLVPRVGRIGVPTRQSESRLSMETLNGTAARNPTLLRDPRSLLPNFLSGRA